MKIQFISILKKIIVYSILILFIGTNTQAQQIDKETIAIQMNSCVMSLTNLNNAPSLSVYNKERDNLLNNLSKEGMVKIPEITQLRESILGTIYQLKITQEEREVLQRIKSIEQDGAKWNAVSNSLNQVMLLVPGYGKSASKRAIATQTAFYTLLTAVRASVEYNEIQKNLNVEEAKALWEIRKQDLKQYASLNTEAYKQINQIFKKYKLSDQYELTPAQATEFNEIIKEEDASRRCQILLDNESRYRYLNDYNYYIGMTYVEKNQYKKASPYFEQYINNEQKAKLFKIDDKLGCIYLAKLTYESNLTDTQIEYYISEALKNLPHNGAAYIQCATAYYAKLNKPEDAFKLLRKALYDDNLSDKEAVIMAVSEWLPAIKQTPIYNDIYTTICQSIDENIGYVSIYSYLIFLIKSEDSSKWQHINKLITITDKKDNSNIKPQKLFKLHFSKNIIVPTEKISIYYESWKDGSVKIREKGLNYPDGYTLEYLCKKFSIIKSHPEIAHLFFNYNQNANMYYVKTSLSEANYDILQKVPGEFEGLSNYNLDFSSKKTADRKCIKKLIKFCKSNQSKSPTHLYILANNQQCSSSHTLNNISYLDNYYLKNQNVRFVNNKMFTPSNQHGNSFYTAKIKEINKQSYQPLGSKSFIGNYITIQFKSDQNNPITVTYKIDRNNKIDIFSIREGNNIYFKNPIKIITNNTVIDKSKKESWFNKIFHFKKDGQPSIKPDQNNQLKKDSKYLKQEKKEYRIEKKAEKGKIKQEKKEHKDIQKEEKKRLKQEKRKAKSIKEPDNKKEDMPFYKRWFTKDNKE